MIWSKIMSFFKSPDNLLVYNLVVQSWQTATQLLSSFVIFLWYQNFHFYFFLISTSHISLSSVNKKLHKHLADICISQSSINQKFRFGTLNPRSMTASKSNPDDLPPYNWPAINDEHKNGQNIHRGVKDTWIMYTLLYGNNDQAITSSILLLHRNTFYTRVAEAIQSCQLEWKCVECSFFLTLDRLAFAHHLTWW